MSKTRPPYPAAFRQQMVDLAQVLSRSAVVGNQLLARQHHSRVALRRVVGRFPAVLFARRRVGGTQDLFGGVLDQLGRPAPGLEQPPAWAHTLLLVVHFMFRRSDGARRSSWSKRTGTWSPFSHGGVALRWCNGS